MKDTIQYILARLCREASAVYIAEVPENRIIYCNEKCCDLIGHRAHGEKINDILAEKPQLRHLFPDYSEGKNSQWEYYDTEHKRLYQMRQLHGEGYVAVSTDDITDVLNLNRAVTDYLRLMNALSDMQAELIANQDKTIEILMKSLVQRFSALAVYISFITRQGKLVLWSLPSESAAVDCCKPDRLPDAIRALPSHRIKAADLTYEFRIVSPEPPELWSMNHAFVMNMAEVYLESFALREQIKWDNGHDKFTGLFNRAHFIMTMSEQYRKLTSVGVVFIDIDNLKNTNDSLGHSAGDALIMKAANALRDISPENAHAYRMGGDEFLLVLCDCTEEQLKNTVLALRQSVETSNRKAPTLLFSCGSAYSEQPINMEKVIREADSRMYAEKLTHKTER